MKYLEFVCIGDVHIERTKSLLPSLGENWFKPIAKIFRDVVSYCQTNTINTVILLGDIFDHPHPDQKSILKFIKLLSKTSWINWYIIEGNHDFASINKTSTEALQFVSNLVKNKQHVKVFRNNTEILKINGIPFCFMPWPQNLSPYTEYPKINIAHVEVNNAKHDNGMHITNGISIPDNKDYWLIGHLHSYQNFGRVIYSGTPLQHNFGETLPKGFLHCTAKYTSNSLKVKHTFIPLITYYKLFNIRAQSDEDLIKITNEFNIYYKLFIKRGYQLPLNYLQDNPQIIKTIGYTTNREVESLEQNSMIIAKRPSLLFDPTFGLRSYMRKLGRSYGNSRVAVNVIEKLLQE